MIDKEFKTMFRIDCVNNFKFDNVGWYIEVRKSKVLLGLPPIVVVL